MVGRLGALGLVLALLAPGQALACRLALLLALDVSSSVDETEFRLQRDGLASALTSPDVEVAFLEGDSPVAIAVYEWSGQHKHQTILDWRLILAQSDLAQAATEIQTVPRSTDDYPTAIGYALAEAARLLRTAPECDRRTIDVSGDGENNDGFGPALAYRNFPLGGVTVNALAIGGSQPLESLVMYFRREVIRGAGAFVETATDYRDFERAIHLKLRREVTARVVGAVR